MGRDYYALLQITKNATDADIKRAYRKLALKYHPDRNQDEDAEDKFFIIAEAYDILNDLKKKATYDKFGEEGLKGGIPTEFGETGAWTNGYTFHGNPKKIFRDFFGGDNPFADFFDVKGEVNMGFGGLRGKSVKTQDPPIERDLYVSLEDLFHGCMKKIKISRRVMNEDGHTSSIKDKILTITVKEGWREGTRITFPKEGDQGPNSIPADIIFILKQKPHERFCREGNDLIYCASISLAKALTGYTVEIQTLNDRFLSIPINDIVHPKYCKVVPMEGMPISQIATGKGNLIIQFDIIFPDKLTPQKKKMINKALQP